MRLVLLITLAVTCGLSQQVLAGEPSTAWILQLEKRIAELERQLAELRRAEADRPSPTPLDSAIASFNAKARANEIGREQPPLTEDEVVAAIRWCQRDDHPQAGDAQFAAFKRIADTKVFPSGAQIEVISRFVPDGEVQFNGWSVRVVMPHEPPNGGTYAFIIRERWIRSRPLTPEEQKSLRARAGLF